MIIKMKSATRNMAHRSVVQHAKRAHVVLIPTTLVVDPTLYGHILTMWGQHEAVTCAE